MKRTVMASAFVLALGCSSSDNNANSANNTGTDGFEAGSYTVTVLDVDDQCFDGAMDTIVLPDGTARDLPAPVTLPAYADLPAAIDIQFNAPFDNVTGVQVEASGNNGVTTTSPFVQDAVDISADADMSCFADMTVEFTLTASEAGKLTGSGSLSITSTEGDNCPVGTPPCSVTSNLEAVKN